MTSGAERKPTNASACRSAVSGCGVCSKLASAVHVTLCCLAGCLIQIDQDRAKLTIMSRRSDPDENIKTHPSVG